MIMFWLIARAAALLALGLLAHALLMRAPASARRLSLLVALAGALVVPPLGALLPASSSVLAVSLPLARAPFAEPLEATHANEHEAASGTYEARGERMALEPWLALAWLLGTALVLVRFTGARLKARRLVQGATQLEPGLLESAGLAVPAVVGLRRPAVVLPSSWRSWSAAELKAVLLHERAHVKHGDARALLLAQLTCAVYWFLPLAWWCARRLRRACELQADAEVVAKGVDPVRYAQHLLDLTAAMVTPAPRFEPSMASELEQRVRALLAGEGRVRWSPGRHAFLAACGAALAVLIACTHPDTGASAAHPEPARASDARVQALVDRAAAHARDTWRTEDVVMLVLDARDRTVLANHGAITQPRVPGSTLKPFGVAAALEAQLITPEQTFDCGRGKRSYGPETLFDASAHAELDVRQLLAVSSNVCMSRVYDLLGGERLLKKLTQLRLGDAPGARPSALEDRSFEGAVVAAGEGLLATPLQLTLAYGALVDGSLAGEQVIQSATARTVRALLEEVVHGAQGTGQKARIKGVRVAGKTGTSIERHDGAELHYASFAGLFPAEQPRYVVYVGLAAARDDLTGGKAAAPLFAELAEGLLAL